MHNQFINQPSHQRVTDKTRASLLGVKDDDVKLLPQRWNTGVDNTESSPRMSQDRETDVLPVQPAQE